MNINVKIRNKQYILSTKLSNHNIAMLEFRNDGPVLDGEDKYYFKDEGKNWWVYLYIGPKSKLWFSKTNKCYGTTNQPLEGLVCAKQMLLYFIGVFMGPKDVIEISGSTMQRDIIYYNVLRRLGFRFTDVYNHCKNIMIYVPYLSGSTGKIDPWMALKTHGVCFPSQPQWEPDDYNYHHPNLIVDIISVPVMAVWYKIRIACYNIYRKIVYVRGNIGWSLKSLI